MTKEKLIHYGAERFGATGWGQFWSTCKRRVNWHHATDSAEKVTCPKCAALLLIASTREVSS